MASNVRNQLLGGPVVALLSAALWYAWMGWDTEYQIDPVTQVGSGPYEAWQVLGCAGSLLVVLVAALLAGVWAVVASAAMTVAFTAAWTVTAAAHDDTGLFGVGAVLVFVGLATASAVVSLATTFLQGRFRRRM